MDREELFQHSHAEVVEILLGMQDVLLDTHDTLLGTQSELDREKARRAELEAQLRWFKQQLFGKKSERRILEEDAKQLCLGEVLPEATPPEPNETVRSYVRRKSGAAKATGDEPGLRFDDSVPVETIEVVNPELEGLADDEIEFVDEKVTHRLAQRPGAYVVLKIIRKVVKRKDTQTLSCPPALPSVLEKSYADVSLLAGMLVDKFVYHLPLYRQHQRIAAAGITLSRTSFTNWAKQSIELLEPIYQAQLASILTSRVLAMDETPIRAGRKAKGKMRTAFFWPIYGDQDEVAFPYAASRSKEHVEAILGAYCGVLLSDGYYAYDHYTEKMEEVVHALCWVHARRGFVKAEDVEPERSAKALDFIGALYEQEERIAKKGLEGTAKLEARTERCKPVVDSFFAWLEQELVEAALLPSNPFTKAALYAVERRKGLGVFLENPDVPPDTNHLERTLRPIPLGRKNWLFCWTEVGAKQVGQIQSLLATCKLHGIDPYTYLVDVLQRIDHHPQAEVEQLTPRLWKHHFADAPLRSMLDSR